MKVLSHFPKPFCLMSSAAILLVPSLLISFDNPCQPKVDASLDRLLGGNGRADHEAKLARQVIAGKTYPWRQYVDWGKELTRTARVQSPPVGKGPSPLMSKTYRCVHCHNFVREDVNLTKQDPKARASMIRKLDLDDPSKRDGVTLSLTPGTTLWGAVNRKSFYNGYYAKYHKLRLQNGQAMDPKRLEDAVQICCNYCSNGRFAEGWELDSILAFLWELEIHLSDLNLGSEMEARVLATAKSGDATRIANMRKFVREQYLERANATPADCPTRAVADGDQYADGKIVRGDAKKGLLLYRSACAGCHGGPVHPKSGGALANNYQRFHRLVLRGTVGDVTYMPFFAQERLSYEQLADIRVYLRSIR